MHIATFKHFVKTLSLTDCQNCKRTMKYCNFFCPNRLNEIKLEGNRRKVYVSLGMTTHHDHQNGYLVFGQFLQIFKTKFSVQTLISQRIMNLIESFTDQNLRKLTRDRKKFEFEKSKI